MAIVVVLAGTWIGYRQFAEPRCTNRVLLTVAAPAEIAPVVDRAAQRWVASGAQVAGTCVGVRVDQVSPAAMASAIGKKHGVTLTGLGEASGTTQIPHVWIADSSTWLVRLTAEAPGFVPTDGRAVAQSPVVVAMPQPRAQQFGWPDRELGWSDLLSEINRTNTLRAGIVDPTRDAAGLAGLLALGKSAGAGAEAQASTAGALRALAVDSSALREELLAKFPRSSAPADIASSLTAAPLSEKEVVVFNATRPPVPLAALYLQPAPEPLDYPYAVLPEVDPLQRAAADGLAGVLTGAAFKDDLAGAGLRAADGTWGQGFQEPLGAAESGGQPAPAPSDAGSSGAAASAQRNSDAISQALGSWAAITLPGRVLAVFDVSGSMLTKVPSAGNLTRAQVTQRAAAQGLSLFDDKWAVGVWRFSTELRGSQDWEELVPISPLTARRTELGASLAQLTPKPNGATGLYDTALAAYKNVQDSWQAGRVNSVILFTDGKNEDDEGLTQQELIQELKRVIDPTRPIRMIIIGIGTEVDRQELTTITAATGGGVFTAEDPAKIGSIFLQAISSRADTTR